MFEPLKFACTLMCLVSKGYHTVSLVFVSVFISSLSTLKVSYCDRSMSAVRRQQLALKAYSSYTPGPIDLKLCRKHLGDL